MNSRNVKISGFVGPFDLLLHLIKQNKMDIYNIKIYELTNQYLEYINQMKELDLEVTSEFIVVAATLIEIKSKTLLPKNEEVHDEDEEDPKEVLLKRLIEYKKFKLASTYLKDCSLYTGQVFTKKPEIIEDTHSKEIINNDDLLKNVTMLKLFKLFNSLMNLYFSKKNIDSSFNNKIKMDKYKIEDKMKEILQSLKDDILIFKDIEMFCECKMEVVVTFLALLELIKIKQVRVVQKESFGNIYIERVELDG